MKKLTIVLALTVFAFNGAKAQVANSSVEKIETIFLQDLGNLRFKLSFENPLRQKTQISLLDKNDNLYFNDFAGNDTRYSRSFNLSNLEDGVYSFVISSGTDKITKEFIISTQTSRGISLALTANKK